MHRDPSILRIVLPFLMWAVLWTWLIRRRTAKMNLRAMFVIFTGFALIAAAMTPDGQDLLGRLSAAWPLLVMLLGISLFVLWVADRGA